jgi:uncharacterized protein (DUF58 family)
VIKLGRSFWWILLLMGVSFLVSQFPWLSNNPIFTRLAITLLVILVMSGMWSVLSLWGITLHRSTRTTRKQVGEVFSEEIEVINQSVIPKVWLKVTDQSRLMGGTGSRVITGVGSKQSRNYVAFTLLQRRGWFALGPTQIESGDIFGLFMMLKTFDTQLRLLVIPYMFDIQFFLAPSGILPGGHALREKTLEVTPYAAGVREYVPGDALKRIHWPSSARKQLLIVKEFEKDPLAEAWIFLDARKSVHIRSEDTGMSDLHQIWWIRYKKAFRLPPDTVEYAISITASLARYYTRQKREVGLVSAGQSYSVLPAERGERQLGKILETLAVLEPEGDLPFWALVNSQVNHLARGSTVLLITPSTDESILTITMELMHRGLIPVIILIDPASFGSKVHAADIAKQLTDQGVITFVIHHGDDVQSVLESPQVLYDRRFVFRHP